MLLSAESVLVVAQSSSEIPEGLMNNPVYWIKYCASEGNKYLCNRPQGHPRKLLADIFIIEVKIYRRTELSVDYSNDGKSPVSRFKFRSMYRAAWLGWRAGNETRAGVECLGDYLRPP